MTTDSAQPETNEPASTTDSAALGEGQRFVDGDDPFWHAAADTIAALVFGDDGDLIDRGERRCRILDYLRWQFRATRPQATGEETRAAEIEVINAALAEHSESPLFNPDAECEVEVGYRVRPELNVFDLKFAARLVADRMFGPDRRPDVEGQISAAVFEALAERVEVAK